MSAPPDDRVDVAALAAQGAVVTRHDDLAGFARLADVLAGPGGSAQSQLRFLQAAAGIPGCELDVRASVTLRCERCLEPFVEALQSSTRLAFVEEGQEAGGVPAGFEELAVRGGRVSLHELVEDELVLSLPLVAKHGEGTDCARGAAAPATGADRPGAGMRRPFAGLSGLLKR